MYTYNYYNWYKRYLSADEEMREATKRHWLRCLASAIREGNETLLEHSSKILAMYALAENDTSIPA